MPLASRDTSSCAPLFSLIRLTSIDKPPGSTLIGFLSFLNSSKKQPTLISDLSYSDPNNINNNNINNNNITHNNKTSTNKHHPTTFSSWLQNRRLPRPPSLLPFPSVLRARESGLGLCRATSSAQHPPTKPLWKKMSTSTLRRTQSQTRTPTLLRGDASTIPAMRSLLTTAKLRPAPASLKPQTWIRCSTTLS